MKKLIILLIIFFNYSLLFAQQADWSYSGNQNADRWGNLSKKYFMCSKGKNQSPVNLSNYINSELDKLHISYLIQNNAKITNNGHTIQLNVMAGSTIKIKDKSFVLQQLHFHTSSEHHILGKSYPLEAHFVHKDIKGNIAVVALIFKLGKHNKTLNFIVNNVLSKKEQDYILNKVNIQSLLPKKFDYYSYNGSLTTPPCTEGVRWFVLKEIAQISSAQLYKFTTIINNNNRPIQKINARLILQ